MSKGNFMIDNKIIGSALLGSWKLIRSIQHKKHNPKDDVNTITKLFGEARWEIQNQHIVNIDECNKKCDNNLIMRYQEKLRPLESSQNFDSWQLYYFTFPSNNSRLIRKYFSDGKLFESIELDEGGINGVNTEIRTFHLCKQDEYRGIYNFGQILQTHPRIEMEHQVTGPRKDYVIKSIYHDRRPILIQ